MELSIAERQSWNQLVAVGTRLSVDMSGGTAGCEGGVTSTPGNLIVATCVDPSGASMRFEMSLGSSGGGDGGGDGEWLGDPRLAWVEGPTGPELGGPMAVADWDFG